MSIALINSAWRLAMPASRKLVLLAMCDWSNDEGTSCHPSIKAVALRSSMSSRQAQRVLRGLEADGWLAVVGNSNGGAPGQTRRYQLNVSAIKTGDTHVTGDKLSRVTPRAETGDTHGTRRVTPRAETGDTHVTQTTIDPPIEPSRTIKALSPADAGEREATEPGQGSEPSAAPTTTPAGRVCQAMRALGVTRFNPSHPHLLAALAEGVAEKTLIDTAAEFVGNDPNCFAYVIAVARKRHARGAKPIATTGAPRHDHPTDQPRESLVDRAAQRAARIFAEHGFDTPG